MTQQLPSYPVPHILERKENLRLHRNLHINVHCNIIQNPPKTEKHKRAPPDKRKNKMYIHTMANDFALKRNEVMIHVTS